MSEGIFWSKKYPSTLVKVDLFAFPFTEIEAKGSLSPVFLSLTIPERLKLNFTGSLTIFGALYMSLILTFVFALTNTYSPIVFL